MLDDLKKKEYRENNGKLCPYCGEESTKISKKEQVNVINNDKSTLEVECKTCGKHWTEIYPIFDIKEEDEQEDS